MKPIAYPKHGRSPSYTQESLCSSSSPTDLYTYQKLDNIERYLNKFDERAARLELSTNTPQENRSFTYNKRTMETSYSDYDPKIRIEDGGYRNNKVENPRRVEIFNDQSRDLPRKGSALRDILATENKQDDIGKVHDRVLGIEKRVDSMDKKLEQLTFTLESFMRRIEGSLAMPERPSFPKERSIQEPSYKVERQSTLECQGIPERELRRPGFLEERSTQEPSYKVERQSTLERQGVPEKEFRRSDFLEEKSRQEPLYKVERQSTLERQGLPDREFIPERQTRVDRRPISEYQAPRQEQRYGEGETIAEVKLLGNNKRADVIKIEDEMPPRRAASRDNGGSIRDRAREFLERDDRDKARTREFLEKDDKEKVRGQERQVERRQEREKSPLGVKAPTRELKGGLKSPESQRKRKSVSWSEMGSPEVIETESSQKRKKFEVNYDELDSSKLFSMDESFKRGDKEKERPRSNMRSRDRVDDSSRVKEVVGQKRSSVTREDGKGPLYDTLHEKYGRYTGDVRDTSESVMSKTEDRFGERSIQSEKDGGNPVEKERMMEEKRKKIDDEIERRISKQIEMKKKADAAIEGQKKVYEKTSQVEDDFKISPYSTEKSRDKEVVSRLVREKQMRSDLISKYSEGDSSNKSKSPLRK